MPGLVPGIHDLITSQIKDVDGRDKPGHDDGDHPYLVDPLSARYP
jgi:hypothetical protein